MTMGPMSALSDFLRRNTVQAVGGLPLVHSTQAYGLLKIVESDEISTTFCDVFKEPLSYFFVGRPAYKFKDDGDEAQEWELPCCFIMEFSSVPAIKRIYPFDTGGYKRYPKYLSMIDREEFEVSDVPNAPQKLIGSFFGSARNYFNLHAKPKPEFMDQYSVRVTEPEVKAAHALAAKSSTSFDDRRFTIEVQSVGTIDLKVIRPLAVILPMIYLDDTDIRSKIEDDWKAHPISYVSSCLNIGAYYGQIYAQVLQFYEDTGYL